ncbi:MAG TPA: hypothetical protein DCR83_07775 [Eubacterium sp.]|nr:hypothetical protein [Eubacterium sp.]HCO35218.1 hypothetical protein [Eubacterium sp.]
MKVKVVLPFLKENESDFKVHCGRGSTDTFLPLRLFLQDQSKFKYGKRNRHKRIFKENIFYR